MSVAAAPPARTSEHLAGTFNGTTVAAAGDSETTARTGTVTVDSTATAHGKLVSAGADASRDRTPASRADAAVRQD